MKEKFELEEAHKRFLAEEPGKSSWPAKLHELKEAGLVTIGPSSVPNAINGIRAGERVIREITILSLMTANPALSFEAAKSQAQHQKKPNSETSPSPNAAVRGNVPLRPVRTAAARLDGLTVVQEQLAFTAKIGLVGVYNQGDGKAKLRKAIKTAVRETKNLKICSRNPVPMLASDQGGEKGWLTEFSSASGLDSVQVLLLDPEAQHVFTHCDEEKVQIHKGYAEVARKDCYHSLPRITANFDIKVLSSIPMPFSMVITDEFLFVEPHCPFCPDGTFDILEFVRPSSTDIDEVAGVPLSFDRLTASFNRLFQEGRTVTEHPVLMEERSVGFQINKGSS